MPHRLYRSFQALLLLALCLFFAGKLASGQLSYYINLRFIPLTIFGVIFLALLAQTLFSENRRSRQQEHEDEHHDHDHVPANLWFMVVPLAIGLLIPARPLDSSAFATKGFNTTGPMVSSDSAAKLFETESQDRNVLDWVKISYYEKDITPYLDQQASVIGFVYRDDQLNENQFYVSRFIISCCAADASSIGMIVNWDDAKTLKQDSWVLVKGSISSTILKDQTLLVIDAESIQDVPVPEQPYLYP
ncbi:MAG: TIGR03943 family protein [Anaerolineales bacterium]|nr:TIGR03943 family protein [Anaerolineales bacterium]